ncbi:MAG: lactonase family protein [Phycisphaeraceae bacterium]|nr:lactonase family protein [Phycisphaeraceae bacterium]
MLRTVFHTLPCLLILAMLALLPACKSVEPPTRQALYLSCKGGKRLLVYNIDPATGQLKETQRLELPGEPGPIALTDDGQHLYAALRNPPRIVPLSRDTATGQVALLQPTPVPDFPTYLDIDATGGFAITASYGPGTVRTFAINDDATIQEGPVQTTKTDRTAHASLIDPSNRFVYIPHTTPNAIYQFRFDDKTGKLVPLQPIVVKGGGKPNQPAGPRHYTYHPTLDIVYVVNELDSSVSAYQWDKQGGALTRFQSLTTLPANFTARNTCADIHLTPDGRFLYASNRGHDSIAAYRLDEEGLMTFIDWFKTEPVPREFAIDVKGQYLYSAGLRSHKLAAYAIDSNTGRLSRIGNYDTPEGPIWVEVVELD